MLKKLRIRFVCITMTITTVMLWVILGMVIHFTGLAIEDQSIQMMRTITPMHGPPGMEREEFRRLPYFVVTVDRHGQAEIDGDYEHLVEASQIPELVRLVQAEKKQTGILKDYDLRYWKGPSPGGERIVFTDITNERATMKNLVQTCIVIGIVGFFAFLGLSILLAKWAIRPVERAWIQQKQFVADASHELKTPLTVIMTNAELMLESGYTEADRRQLTESIFTMASQMRGLVLGLLELTRVDNGAVKTAMTNVDMSALVSEGMLHFEPLFFEKGLSLSEEIEGEIQIHGSESHLHQVLDILLDNAMKYSDPMGQVLVRLKKQGSYCILSVASTGQPLSRQELKDIFKRFYRVDKVRSRSGSYGLGLAIAESIVEEHQGRIWAESENKVNTFHVLLPAVR